MHTSLCDFVILDSPHKGTVSNIIFYLNSRPFLISFPIHSIMLLNSVINVVFDAVLSKQLIYLKGILPLATIEINFPPSPEWFLLHNSKATLKPVLQKEKNGFNLKVNIKHRGKNQ